MMTELHRAPSQRLLGLVENVSCRDGGTGRRTALKMLRAINS